MDDTVQNAFRYSNNHQMVLRSGRDPHNTSTNGTSDTGSVRAPDVSVLDAHSTGGLSEVMGASPAVPNYSRSTHPFLTAVL